MENIELTLDERVEVALATIRGIGAPTASELAPNPANMTRNEIHSIIWDYVISIARMELWATALQNLKTDERTDRTELLQVMLAERQHQACQIIFSLQSVNGIN